MSKNVDTEAQKRLRRILRECALDGAMMTPGMTERGIARVHREVREDSVDFVNLSRDFETRILKPYRDKFRDLRSREFIPANTDGIMSMSETWLAQFLTQVGTAEMVTDYSADLPVISVAGRPFSGKLATFGGAGQWSAQDVLRAVQGVFNLPTETLTALRRAIDTAMDRCLAIGAPKAGINGFLTHPDVSIVPLPTGNWGAHTVAENVADFSAYVATIRAQTNFIESSAPNTVLLDPESYMLLAGQYDNTSFGKSALEMIRANSSNHGITDIDQWSYLSTAGTGAGPRSVIYRRDPQMVSGIVALEYYQLEPQKKGLVIQVPALARCGGVVVIEPLAMAYFENMRS